MKRQPPRLASTILRLRFSRAKSEFLLGDLMEEYAEGERTNGWYWRQALSLLWTRPAWRQRSAENFSGGGMLASFGSDLRYAARGMGASRGLTAAAILAVALGVGVNTGIFTLLNGMALRPLPVRDARSMVSVYQTIRGLKNRNVNGNESYFSFPEYENYRRNNHVFSGVLAYYPFFRATLGGERPRAVDGTLTTCNYFDVLQARPTMGRGFLPSDCAGKGAAAVVVLRDGFWRSQFGGDAALIGKAITLNRTRFTVVGVATTGFQGTEPLQVDFWAPVTMQAALNAGDDSIADENLSWLVIMGRLKPGVPLSEVRADLGVIAGRIDQRYPGRKTTLTVDVATFFGAPDERSGVLSVAAVLLAAVGLVLLIACANVANLLLARAAARRKEIAVRLSVGASRRRLIRQLMTESVLLALPGGLLGSALAFASIPTLTGMALSGLPANFPHLTINTRPDLAVLGYSLGLTLLTGIVFGLAPALQSTRLDLSTALKEEGSGGGSVGSRSWLRNALVVVQVSVCLVLLITAGLLLRGLQAAQSVEPGFEMKDVAYARFDLLQQGYDDARAARFHRALKEKVAALPGVDGVAEAIVIPLSHNTYGTSIDPQGGTKNRQITYDVVTPQYFSLLAIPIVRGRNFTEQEARTGGQVVIVMESTARKLWPNQDPLGKTFVSHGAGNSEKSVEVVGVAADSRTSSLGEVDPYFFYFPTAPDSQQTLNLLAHGSVPFAAMAKEIRGAARAIDPDIIVDVHPMEENLELYRLPSRIVTALSAVLGGFALLLASIGIYGVVSYAVSRRVREIGIRMTLGADAGEVMGMVLRGALRPVLLGAAVGVAGCAAVSRVLSSLLFGVSPFDPLAFGAVTLFLIGVAAAASYIPARRAARLDPMVALRYE